MNNAIFPPQLQTIKQTEINCNRTETRELTLFAVTSEQVCFPHVTHAAKLTQTSSTTKLDKKTNEPITKTSESTVFLITSKEGLTIEEFLALKRAYWDIENGAHQRLDVSRLNEDKSRVRTRNSAINLGLFRRAVLSLARQWIDKQPNPRKATTNGFLGAMKKDRYKKAFNLVTAQHPSWLP